MLCFRCLLGWPIHGRRIYIRCLAAGCRWLGGGEAELCGGVPAAASLVSVDLGISLDCLCTFFLGKTASVPVRGIGVWPGKRLALWVAIGLGCDNAVQCKSHLYRPMYKTTVFFVYGISATRGG